MSAVSAKIAARLLEDTEAAAEDYHARWEEQLREILAEFKAGRKLISWKPLPAETVIAVWLEYGRRGTVRNEETVDKLADQLLNLIARLGVSTALAGHESYSMKGEVEEELGYPLSEEEEDRLMGMLEDEKGNYLLSDAAMRPLERLYITLFRAVSVDDQIVTMDKIFNVVHQRSELAALFVQGGVKTLNRIASQGGYVAPEEAKHR